MFQIVEAQNPFLFKIAKNQRLFLVFEITYRLQSNEWNLSEFVLTCNELYIGKVENC